MLVAQLVLLVSNAVVQLLGSDRHLTTCEVWQRLSGRAAALVFAC